MSFKTNCFPFSPKKKSSAVHPGLQLPDAQVDKNPMRPRNDSLEQLEQHTIHNTSFLDFNGNIYNAKIVDVDEFNMIQVIFKFNNQYNLWKCKLNFKSVARYDEKLTNIYLKSFINTIQIIKCFIFDKNNYLLIDIIDKFRLSSAVNYICDTSYSLQMNNLKTNRFQKFCESTLNCMSEAATSDVIDYDEYVKIIYNK